MAGHSEVADQGLMNIQVYQRRTIGQDCLIGELESPLQVSTLSTTNGSEGEMSQFLNSVF
jgi:hypothetical protein